MTRQKWTILVIGLLLIGAGAGLLAKFKRVKRLGNPGLKVRAAAEAGKLEIVLPERVADFLSTNVPPNTNEVAMLPKDTTITKRLYRARDDFQTFVSVVMMGADRTSIHKPEYCLTAQDWRILGKETTFIRINRPHPYDLAVRKFTATRTVQAPSGEPVVLMGIYVFWFVAEDRLTASHLGRVWWLTWDLLRTGVLPRWAYVSCFSTCLPGQETAAYERLKRFLAAAVPEFQSAAGPPVASPERAAARRVSAGQ